ncbi:GNAT family N-acetyltransferase [Myxococcus stipitatus]|uniref:GNAT family N-acetyltransferase n=1 Tax=Myxococcus stipitatus TaxID=83455 RepID=UPI001F3BD23B|nr:GNAT family N-acetyltransferase [Myxococcus stipitatus]MCE9671982.1 GNAT family N-acetyltransferase [Myxococcus stipitatus]
MELVLATDAQKAERDRVTHAAWGSPLTVEQFQQREARLRAHPWCREGMRTWLLMDGGRVLASCETLAMDSYLRGPDGAHVKGTSEGIASVFTEEALRGHGYATRLMDLVAARMEAESPAPHSLLLFSDVGAPLYRRSGYHEAPAWDWRLPAAGGLSTHAVDALLCDGDVPLMLEQMRRPDVPFFLWPSAAQVDWHLERERAYAQLLNRPRPEACGAVVGSSCVLWAMMARYDELVVLLMDAGSLEDAVALLEAARGVAHRAGLSKVVIWEEPGTLPWVARVSGAVRVARDGALPMLRPLRPGLPPATRVDFPRALWV